MRLLNGQWLALSPYGVNETIKKDTTLVSPVAAVINPNGIIHRVGNDVAE